VLNLPRRVQKSSLVLGGGKEFVFEQEKGCLLPNRKARENAQNRPSKRPEVALMGKQRRKIRNGCSIPFYDREKRKRKSPKSTRKRTNPIILTKI